MGAKQPSYVIGLDAGGTKTIALVADTRGEVLGVGHAGPANFQSAGRVSARSELDKAIRRALRKAKVKRTQVVFCAYGVSGADRDDDFTTVSEILEPITPSSQFLLVNDTTVALRAGTKDGVGVALIAGTGSNCIGFNAQGGIAKVGGNGRLMGDLGYAEALVEDAIMACFRALDGRGPDTKLIQMFCEAMGVGKLEDLFTSWYADSYHPPRLGDYAPVLFQAAAKHDKVALQVIDLAARERSAATIAALRRLGFGKKDKPTVVYGGSVFQKSTPPVFPKMVTEYILKRYPQANCVKLKHEPVVGGVLLALDRVFEKTTPMKIQAWARRSAKVLLAAG